MISETPESSLPTMTSTPVKRLIILSILFAISVAVALGLVINEQVKRTSGTAILKDKENKTENAKTGTATEQVTVAPTLPASTVEGNITLSISAPQTNTTTKDSSVTVKGTTTPGASIIVNEYELTAGVDGTFTKTVTLDDGENYISVIAYTSAGAVAEKELKITKEVENYE